MFFLYGKIQEFRQFKESGALVSSLTTAFPFCAATYHINKIFKINS